MRLQRIEEEDEERGSIRVRTRNEKETKPKLKRINRTCPSVKHDGELAFHLCSSHHHLSLLRWSYARLVSDHYHNHHDFVSISSLMMKKQRQRKEENRSGFCYDFDCNANDDGDDERSVLKNDERKNRKNWKKRMRMRRQAEHKEKWKNQQERKMQMKRWKEDQLKKGPQAAHVRRKPHRIKTIKNIHIIILIMMTIVAFLFMMWSWCMFPFFSFSVLLIFINFLLLLNRAPRHYHVVPVDESLPTQNAIKEETRKEMDKTIARQTETLRQRKRGETETRKRNEELERDNKEDSTTLCSKLFSSLCPIPCLLWSERKGNIIIIATNLPLSVFYSYSDCLLLLVFLFF